MDRAFIQPLWLEDKRILTLGIRETRGGRLQQLQDKINHGRPAVHGMLNRNNEGPGMGHHQIIAIGYEGSGKDDKIFVYDPNYSNQTKLLHPHPEEYCYYYDDFNQRRTTTSG
ncbi:MAG TPA: hypothetical protein VNI77_05150 [Nitrososphaera sp.]|nr:hypothetical protein [Nitrososphaera sp.]